MLSNKFTLILGITSLLLIIFFVVGFVVAGRIGKSLQKKSNIINSEDREQSINK